MQVKEYLQRYRNIVSKRKALTKRLAEVDKEIISIGGIDYSDKIQNSPKNDPIGEIVIQLTDKKAGIGLQILELQAKESIYENQIMKMAEIDQSYFEILVYRYMFCYDWREVSEAMHYGRTQINNIHGKALKLFDEMFKISKSEQK